MTTMLGDVRYPECDFNDNVKALFEKVRMNPLETGMLEHHLKDFENLPANLTKLAEIL